MSELAPEAIPQEWAGLSKSWQSIFADLQAGEPFVSGLPNNFSKLPGRSRFSIIAFLIGPLYYFYLRMWQKGCLLLALGFLILPVMEGLELMLKADFTHMLSLPLSVICMMWAKIDYYKFRVHHQVMWEKFAPFAKTSRAVAAMVVCFVIAFLFQMAIFTAN